MSRERLKPPVSQIDSIPEAYRVFLMERSQNIDVRQFSSIGRFCWQALYGHMRDDGTLFDHGNEVYRRKVEVFTTNTRQSHIQFVAEEILSRTHDLVDVFTQEEPVVSKKIVGDQTFHFHSQSKVYQEGALNNFVDTLLQSNGLSDGCIRGIDKNGESTSQTLAASLKKGYSCLHAIESFLEDSMNSGKVALSGIEELAKQYNGMFPICLRILAADAMVNIDSFRMKNSASNKQGDKLSAYSMIFEVLHDNDAVKKIGEFQISRFDPISYTVSQESWTKFEANVAESAEYSQVFMQKIEQFLIHQGLSVNSQFDQTLSNVLETMAGFGDETLLLSQIQPEQLAQVVDTMLGENQFARTSVRQKSRSSSHRKAKKRADEKAYTNGFINRYGEGSVNLWDPEYWDRSFDALPDALGITIVVKTEEQLLKLMKYLESIVNKEMSLEGLPDNTAYELRENEPLFDVKKIKSKGFANAVVRYGFGHEEVRITTAEALLRCAYEKKKSHLYYKYPEGSSIFFDQGERMWMRVLNTQEAIKS